MGEIIDTIQSPIYSSAKHGTAIRETGFIGEVRHGPLNRPKGEIAGNHSR